MSVVIPNHNYGRFVGDAVLSTLQQDVDVEVVVVDNGSTDNSLEVLEQFSDHVTIITQDDQGQAAARNQGILSSSGEFIAFLDADDIWFPGKLLAQLEVMRLHPDASLVSCAVWEIDGAGNRMRSVTQPKSEVLPQDFIRHPERGWVLCGESTALIRRSRLGRTSLLDPNLSTASGWDLFRRLCGAGRVMAVPEPLAGYRIHGGNTSRRHRQMIRDMRYAYKKARLESKSHSSWVSRYQGGLSLSRSIIASHVHAREWGPASTQALRGLLGVP